MCSLTRATLGRLPLYLNHVRQLQQQGENNTSATAIARALGMGEVQVRKDLSAISGAGKPKTGYQIGDLLEALEKALGHRQKTRAFIVGAGKLGKALMSYDGFAEYGLEIAAAFDTDPHKTNTMENGKPIKPMESLEAFLQENPAPIGILTVPPSAAQTVCDRLVACGVRAIWSFAPGHLQVPDGVCVQHENLALSLACLNGQRNA